MTAVAGHDKSFARILVSTATSLLVLSPSLATAWGMMDNALPLQPALKISCLILFLASVNFATAIMLEPYHRLFSRLSTPAMICMASTVFIFIMLEALRTYFPVLGYSLLTPFVVAGGALIYAAIFFEKNVPLKCLLSLDSIALMFLWALGAADKFTVPF